MANLDLDLAGTAVLAMDFQQGIVSIHPMVKERNVVQKAKTVVERARRVGVPVIHVVIQFRDGYPEVSSRNRIFSAVKQGAFPKQRGPHIIGSEETKIVKDLSPAEGEVIVNRPRVNPFYNSELQSILSAKEVHTLALMGITTEWIVEATARHAADADYRVIVLEDCCAGMIVEAHDSAIKHILNLIAEVSTSEEFVANLK